MKRVLSIVVLLFLTLIPLVSAQTIQAGCNLEVSLIDQDPHPAPPGEYVKLLFQVKGVDNPNCGTLTFQLNKKYPLVFDPGFTGIFKVESGVFAKNFRSFWLLPVNVRVDPEAVEGNNTLDVSLSSAQTTEVIQFDLEIEDTRTDFEVSIKDYDSKTNTMTFEILNTGENDVEALTIEILTQDSLVVKGSSRNIIGSLDSNEDSTFSFEGKPKDGDITMHIIYTDKTGERRTLEKRVNYNSSYFKDRVSDSSTRSPSFYILVILIIGAIAFWFYKRWKKQKAKKKHHHLTHTH